MSNEYFFVMPSFALGAARAVDIGGTLDAGSYLLSATPADADARAIASDWRVVKQNLGEAMVAYGTKEQHEEK